MSIRSLETEILAEAKAVLGNAKLRLMDIMEWCSGAHTKTQDGEITAFLPKTGVTVWIKKELDKRSTVNKDAR